VKPTFKALQQSRCSPLLMGDDVSVRGRSVQEPRGNWFTVHRRCGRGTSNVHATVHTLV